MPDYRRYRMPGGTYFFTVNLLERRLDTLVRHVDVLREAVRVLDFLPDGLCKSCKAYSPLGNTPSTAH